MSSPSGLWTPPDTSDTATIEAPSFATSVAEIEPTLPKPCTATRAPLSGSAIYRHASRMQYCTPRPVASRRPSEPPISSGLPVTTAVSVRRACIE
jgi:hypothetical protein